MNMQAQWEDETTNRQIRFSIDYVIENEQVNVTSVTPTKVTLIDPDTNTIIKSMGVHSDGGRKLLLQRFTESGQLEATINQIAERHGLLASV